MGLIYKITNDINGKIYIGKTEFSIEKRFKEHCLDAFRERCEKRPLYAAMRKYGIEHFHIELIEETNIPEEREKYWIQYYESYGKGYNATIGGDGSCLYDHTAILERLKNYPYPKEVAMEFGCCTDIVADIAAKNGIKVKNPSQERLQANMKTVYQYDKNKNLINIFNSTVEAAKWCFENKKTTTLNSGVRAHICECANNKRKSAYGYLWSYVLLKTT